MSRPSARQRLQIYWVIASFGIIRRRVARGNGLTARLKAWYRGRSQTVNFFRAISISTVILAIVVSGCGSGKGKFIASSGNELPVSEPPAPHESGPNKDIIAALECVNRTGLLHQTRFAIAVHADGTGKTTSGYEGATGSILPQGTSAIWAAQAVMYAGGVAQNYYELNTERALRQFGGAGVEKGLTNKSSSQEPQFVVSTAFTALDFLGGPDVDVRVAGIGPQLQARGASLEVSAEIYRPGDRTTLAISSMTRQIRYNFYGLNVSKMFESLNNTLITGGISWADQQKIQEASRDLIALAVADVLTRVPGTNAGCRQQVEALLNNAPLKTPETSRKRFASNAALSPPERQILDRRRASP